VETADALAELFATSPAVEAATVFDDDSEPLGSVGAPAAAALAGRTLLEGAAGRRGVGEATQIHASLAAGDVFVVGNHGGPAILAVTAPGQASGLLFHDLKRCLASVVAAQCERRSEVRE
jgi:hypothetical protein